jgi:cell division protein FtsQ
VEDVRSLPLLQGAGAAAAAGDILAALENAPAVRERLHALTRIGRRRWDLELVNGVRVLLPEQDPARALARLEGLHRLHELLDQPVDRLDMRHAGELLVLPGPKREAAPAAAQIAPPRTLAQRA